MSHGPAIDLGHDQPPLPNQHFSSWLRGQTSLFISQIVAILGFISFLASLVYYVLHLKEPGEFLERADNVRLLVDYAHIVFMALFSIVLIRFLDDNDPGSYRVMLVYERVFGKDKGDPRRHKCYLEQCENDLKLCKGQLKKFKRFFLCFWIGMLCLYVSFACQHGYEWASSKHGGESAHGAQPSVSVTVKEPDGKETAYQFAPGSGAAGAAETAHQGEGKTQPPLESHGGQDGESTSAEPGGGEGSSDDKARLPPWLAVGKKFYFEFSVFLFNNFTLLMAYWCFLVMHVSPKEKEKERKYWALSLLAVGTLTLLFLSPVLVGLRTGELEPRNWENYVAVFDALSGVINALVLAQLIARLDSKLVGLPSWLISILYSYAAVQPLFIVFELGQSDVLRQISVFVLIFVFLSKVYFFLIIIYALQTGKMLNYLFCFHVLRDNARAARQVEKQQAGQAEKQQVAAAGARKKFGLRLRELSRSLKAPRALLSASQELVSGWLRSEGTLWLSMGIGLASIFYFFISLIYSQLSPELTRVLGGQGILLISVLKILRPPDSFLKYIDYAQLAAVLSMFLILRLVFSRNDYDEEQVAVRARNIFGESPERRYATEEGEKQLRKFKKYFLYFWAATFLLYGVFLLRHQNRSFFLCLQPPDEAHYHSLLLSTGDGAPHEAPPAPLEVKYYFPPRALEYYEWKDSLCERDSLAFMFQIMLYPFLEFLFATLNLLFLFRCFAVLHSPAFDVPAKPRRGEPKRQHFFDKRARTRQRLMLNYSGFMLPLLIAVFPLLLFAMRGPTLSEDGMRGYATIFDGITGTLSAVALALLIARMDSKLFGLPPRSMAIWILFTYASIQPLFVAFALNVEVLNMVQTAVLVTALGLKICFFMIVAHSLQSGKVINYLICFPFLRDRVESIFENQFEIRLAHAGEHSFHVLILKKNQPHYSVARAFKTREECDEFVHDLRKRMKRRSAYRLPRPASGTYWIEVRSGRSRKHPEVSAEQLWLCESVPLRSEEEAHDLIDESIDKIPYCKYNRT